MTALSRFNNKMVELMTDDGNVFIGIAEVFPSGYGLHIFNREEESVQVDGIHIFKSDIRSIEMLSSNRNQIIAPGEYDDLIGELLEGSYSIVDVLPKQVPVESGGQYFTVERYYLQTDRIRHLRRKYAEILLRLNCYFDMVVSFDGCKSWEKNPDPMTFANMLVNLSTGFFLRAIFESERAMIDIEPDDTYMTIYDPGCHLMGTLNSLVYAEGFFTWNPSEDNGKS